MLGRFPENRFTALEEVQSLLSLRRFELTSFLKVFCKADDGGVRFTVGNLSIELTTAGYSACYSREVFNDDSNTGVQVSFELPNDPVTRSVAYQFSLKKLASFSGKRQLKLENSGGN